MRMIGTMVVLALVGAAAGCKSNGSNGSMMARAPLQTVFDAQGCPVEVRPDNSCAGEPKAPPGAVCRKTGHQISWQAVDQNGQSTQTEFLVRFNRAEDPLDPDSSDPKCSESKRGLLKCKVKTNAKAQTAYKYVVDGANTECPGHLDPRLYVQ